MSIMGGKANGSLSAGIVPLDPETVLSRMDIKLQILTSTCPGPPLSPPTSECLRDYRLFKNQTCSLNISKTESGFQNNPRALIFDAAKSFDRDQGNNEPDGT